jgi:glycosyltransferase involved in cell wall biosynthesis
MRLLFVTTSYPSKANPSSGIFVHLLAKSLRDIGHDIQVITPADDEKHGFEIFEDIEIHRVWYAPKRMRLLAQRPGGIPAAIKEKPHLLITAPFLVLFMAVKIAKMSRNFDIIHGHWEISGFIYGISSIKKLHNHFVLTLRGEHILNMRNNFIKRIVYKFILNKSSYIVSVNDKISFRLKEILYKYGIPLPVYTIRNGVDKKFFSLQYPITISPIEILYVGSLISRKRVDVLIRACKNALDSGVSLRLTIVGDGAEKRKILKIIETDKLGSYISVIHAVEPIYIHEIMEKFHCLALFSASEGSPNVVIEAMAAGRAILATNLPGVIELMGDSACGYTAPVDDVCALSNIILKACKEPELLKNMGERARARIQQLGLSWEKTGRSYEEIYQRTIQ